MRAVIGQCVLAGVALALGLLAAQAQDHPSRPIRIIVPVPPGGGVDLAARLVGQRLGDILGRQIVIENQPGASSVIAAQTVAKAAPDGYTLLFAPSDFITLPALMPLRGFDPSKELTPIAMVSSNPLVVAANANAPFSTVNELIATAKASAGGIAFGTPGAGTVNRVVGEWIAMAAKINLMNVPYRGGPATARGIAAGEVPLGIVSPIAVYPGLVEAGKVKVIALTAPRAPSLPASWPTLAESGLPIEAALWLGLFAPAGTPAAVASSVDQAVGQALHDDSLRKRMTDVGINPDHIGQAALIARIESDTAHYDQVIRQTGIRVEQ
jgi:tripartite-type tricarboxylate transporter receptor subunit TctC